MVYKKNIKKKNTVTDKIWSSIRFGCHLDGFNWFLDHRHPRYYEKKNCRLSPKQRQAYSIIIVYVCVVCVFIKNNICRQS